MDFFISIMVVNGRSAKVVKRFYSSGNGMEITEPRLLMTLVFFLGSGDGEDGKKGKKGNDGGRGESEKGSPALRGAAFNSSNCCLWSDYITMYFLPLWM